jgi:magnesium-transporting ATPase (P-type)
VTKPNAGPVPAAQRWHAMDVAQAAQMLATGPRGLGQDEARARLAHYGPNRLSEVPPPSNLSILLHQFASPLIYLLFAAALVSLVLGEMVDAGVIGFVLVLNATIGFVQERRAEVSVRALMRLAAPHARVLRDAREWDIESAALVPGDLVLLESGTRVPADLRLTIATALLVDESLLTGEAAAVAKHVEPLDAGVATPDRRNMVYAGTTVRSGRARGYVVATGSSTELGSIAEYVREEARRAAPLQARIERLGRLVGIVVGAAAVLAFTVGLLSGRGAVEMFLLAVALAVAAVPEGLPVAITITLARGVRRMAQRHAIVRRLASVETLGSTTVIGSDKTGTLTENRMTVQRIWADGRLWSLGDGEASAAAEAATGNAVAEHRALYLTLLAGVLSNDAEIYRTADDAYDSLGDPTEAALLLAAARLGIEPAVSRERYRCEAELPFEPDLRYSASVCRRDDEPQLFVKGAPERVLAMCDQMMVNGETTPLSAEQVLHAAQHMAASGLRVLAMAYRPLPESGEPAARLRDPQGLVFLGVQGMRDPPRPGVREAIAGCQRAGIRVLMITGDHEATARAIGTELGIAAPEGPALTGAEVDAMSDGVLRERVREVTLYARVSPEHKLRIVRALRDNGEVVAVTGDGVNDAPALKAADIGIAMGKTGTDVAREAADMVLVDDNFVSIYGAVEEGRITFDNIRKVTFFLISTNTAEIITLLVALVLGWPLPLLAAQLLWLNLVTEGLQDIALAFEPGEPGILQRRPRAARAGIVSRLLWERTALAGIVQATGALSLFTWELAHSGSLARAQTAALTTLVLFEAFHVGNSRSERTSLFRISPVSNPFLFLAAATALAVHVAALYLPATQYVLRIVPLDAVTWLRMLAVASTIVVAMELHKWLRRPASE